MLFRSPTFNDALKLFSAMFGITGAEGGSLLLSGIIYTQGNVLMMLLCAILAFQPVQAFDWVERLTWFKVVLLIALFSCALMAMFAQAFNPFLYFQF